MISLHDVAKIYQMGAERIHALDGVDLTITEREYVAVMGASGSGKSTLMNIVGCLDRPTRGEYHLDGQDTTRLSNRALSKVRNEKIGFIFQNFELMPRLTALRNVEMPLLYSSRRHPADRPREALGRVGLADRVTHRPNQLSGGQKQRVAIARALVNDPAILLADEPTGSLDSKTTEEILDLFDQLHAEGQTIIVVTHEEDVARRSRRIIRMQDGKIVTDEPVTAHEPVAAEAKHGPTKRGSG